MGSYTETYQLALDKPEEFWAAAADDLVWQKRWDKILDETNSPFNNWFSGGQNKYLLQCAGPPCRRRELQSASIDL